jgi:sulfur carrier protein ThiS adenylyltransferase
MNFAEIQNILKNKTVGIAGCGGLGSNCAVALARVGVGNLIIVDFDIIEKSNLNRQYFFFNQIGEYKAFALKKNINNINPDVEVIAHNLKLQKNNIKNIFKSCDIIVEAFDKAEMKQMLTTAVLSHFPSKTLVMGIGLAGWGANETIFTQTMDNIIICGDQAVSVEDNNPPLAPRVGIVANMQANIVLECLLGKNQKLLNIEI